MPRRPTPQPKLSKSSCALQTQCSSPNRRRASSQRRAERAVLPSDALSRAVLPSDVRGHAGTSATRGGTSYSPARGCRSSSDAGGAEENGGEPPFVQAIGHAPMREIDARDGCRQLRHPSSAGVPDALEPLACGVRGARAPSCRSGSESGGRERALGRSRPLSRQRVALTSPRRRRATMSSVVPPSSANRPMMTSSGGSSPPVAGSADSSTMASSESRPGSSGSPKVW